MLLLIACPSDYCEGQVSFEVEAGVEGDAAIPYGTRTVYEGGLWGRTCQPEHAWTPADDGAAWDTAAAAYRDA